MNTHDAKDHRIIHRSEVNLRLTQNVYSINVYTWYKPVISKISCYFYFLHGPKIAACPLLMECVMEKGKHLYTTHGTEQLEVCKVMA